MDINFNPEVFHCASPASEDFAENFLPNSSNEKNGIYNGFTQYIQKLSIFNKPTSSNTTRYSGFDKHLLQPLLERPSKPPLHPGRSSAQLVAKKTNLQLQVTKAAPSHPECPSIKTNRQVQLSAQHKNQSTTPKPPLVQWDQIIDRQNHYIETLKLSVTITTRKGSNDSLFITLSPNHRTSDARSPAQKELENTAFLAHQFFEQAEMGTICIIDGKKGAWIPSSKWGNVVYKDWVIKKLEKSP